MVLKPEKTSQPDDSPLALLGPRDSSWVGRDAATLALIWWWQEESRKYILNAFRLAPECFEPGLQYEWGKLP